MNDEAFKTWWINDSEWYNPAFENSYGSLFECKLARDAWEAGYKHALATLPQPSTEVPTVPGVYLMKYGSECSHGIVEIVIGTEWNDGELMYHFNSSRYPCCGKNEFVDKYSICEATFTLIREDT